MRPDPLQAQSNAFPSSPDHLELPHHHLRGEYCLAAMMAPPVPFTKPASLFLAAWSEAVRFEASFDAFVKANPDAFPGLTSEAEATDWTADVHPDGGTRTAE